MGQGLWGREHTAPRETVRACPPSSSSHGVPTLPQPSSASAPLPPSLLGSGAALSPHGSWRLHGPEPIQGMPVPAKPNWLTCLVFRLSVKSHPCILILILTPVPSSSPLHPHLYARILILTPAPSSSPLHPHPQHCTLILTPAFHTQPLSSALLHAGILGASLTALSGKLILTLAPPPPQTPTVAVTSSMCGSPNTSPNGL